MGLRRCNPNGFTAKFFDNLKYFKVLENERGLTRQRNYGVERVGEQIEVVCF
jgi:hypothetical protein